MSQSAQKDPPQGKVVEGISEFLYFAGSRYWTASLLPALAGTTLPFWLRPPGFTFQRLGAIEFLLATLLFHAGFSFLKSGFEGEATPRWSKPRLLSLATACILLACLLGLHINSGLQLNQYVFKYIFILYGLAALIVGMIYAVPPASLCRRPGGEIVLAEGLGMIPVLGAYLVQAGDLTRTVYIASLALVVATGLWVWIDKLITRLDDEKAGRQTLVMEFDLGFSGRYAVLGLALLLFMTVLLAVLSGSIPPLALVTLLLIPLAWKIVVVSWKHHANPQRMLELRKYAYLLHLAVGIIVVVSPLVELSN